MRISRSFLLYGTLGSLLACAAALVLYPVFVANSVRSELRRIHAGTVSVERLRRWAERHGGTVACANGRCEANVNVNNSLLSALHLAPLTYLDASVVTTDGQLTQTSLQLSDLDYSAPRRGASTQLLVDYTASVIPESRPIAPHVGQEPQGKPPSIVYLATPRSGQRAIDLAYNINVWCLAQIGGCRPVQQAPDVWALRK
jgi:hypothetical protein